ncbi:hypothetical protein [Halorussus lipolyticus]|uniref:hypothetical protein n=1 Tax=Halorussus lipolyticus TaxID=3034024 RepID=UPI0023E8F7E3|nr:hypothetical protein [Halorussus sp. DT80]
MASAWRQLLPQFLIMLVLYFLGVALLAVAGIEGFVPRVIVAIVIAFGYPAVLRRMGRAPPAWER